jgi:hypothetical protein
MKLKVAVYNVEWMTRLFDSSGELRTTGAEATRAAKLANIVGKMSPDILGIVEGPDTTVSGSKSASKQIEKWAVFHGLHASYKGVHGFPSNGQQELCALYRSDKIKVVFKPRKDSRSIPLTNNSLLTQVTLSSRKLTNTIGRLLSCRFSRLQAHPRKLRG